MNLEGRSYNRLHQIVFVVSGLLLSWLGMLALHELGHVVGAWLTGGEVVQVVLHPLTISRTDVSPNPRPLLVVWAGPILGCLLPSLGYLLAVVGKLPAAYLMRFFCGFCLIANGTYIGLGCFGEIGDAGVMLQHGSAIWQLFGFGLIATVTGLYLWNGLGPQFGLGEGEGAVGRVSTYTIVCILIVVILLEIWFSQTG